MPLAKIHIRKGQRAQKKRAIADALQASLIAILDTPEEDRFQLIQEYEDDHFIHTDAFLGLTYTRDLLMIEIALTEGRSDALKKMEQRVGAPDLSSFVRSIIQADQLGISLGRLLRLQASESRLKRQAAAEEKAMKSPIKMLFPTVIFIFPAMFIVILGPAMLNILTLF